MRLVLSLVVAALLLVSCDQSANRVSTLWTNVPEIASAVEKFNASQREWQLLVEYKEDPAALLTSPGVKADLVIARNLASNEVKNALVPLDFLFDGGNLAKASFYQRSLEAGQQGDRLKLLPVSVDFPVLLFSPKGQPDLPGFSISADALKDLNQAFATATAPKSFRRQAFSPRWAAFGPTFLQWTGAAFQENFQGGLGWDPALTTALGRFQNWPAEGWAQTTEFQRKYLQLDAFPTLASGRIQFYPSTLATFLNRPWKERRDLDFRFLDVNGRVLAADTTVWAGIPSSSMTRGAGERFLAWFFQSETQKTLIASGRLEDDRSFGLAQGLSSLVNSNGGPMVQAYPELAGRLPTADQVIFWPTLPSDWPTLKASVLRPWLEGATAQEAGLRSGIEQLRSQATQR